MGQKRHRAKSNAIALAGAILVLVLSACWNESFQDNAVYGDAGGCRFDMLIDPEPKDLDATYLLVDRATGDVWRFEASSPTAGRWVRLADGPTDAADLKPRADDDGNDGDQD